MSAAVTVRVPGSTSNLGAGFDCVGIAIDRWIRVAARREESRAAPITIERGGALAGPLPPPPRGFLLQGLPRARPAGGRRAPPRPPALGGLRHPARPGPGPPPPPGG